MANAKLRPRACGGLRELEAHELGLVSGAWGFFGFPRGGDSTSLTVPSPKPYRPRQQRLPSFLIPKF